MAGQLHARVRATRRILPSDEHQTPIGVNVVRWPLHVGLNDHPRMPLAHSGWTVDLANARTLGEAMKAGHPAQVNAIEGAVLHFEPQFPRLRPHSQREGWSFDEAGAQALGDALIAAADHVEGNS